MRTGTRIHKLMQNKYRRGLNSVAEYLLEFIF
jgi:hypothetical protein